jgi:hypothetical protein
LISEIVGIIDPLDFDAVVRQELFHASFADLVATSLEPLFDVGQKIALRFQNRQRALTPIQSREVFLDREVFHQERDERTTITTLEACDKLTFVHGVFAFGKLRLVKLAHLPTPVDSHYTAIIAPFRFIVNLWIRGNPEPDPSDGQQPCRPDPDHGTPGQPSCHLLRAAP